MKVSSITSRLVTSLVQRVHGHQTRYVACNTPPDVDIAVDHPPGPERWFRLLFQRWYPRGRNRPGYALEEEIESWIDGLLKGEASWEQREAFYYQVRPLGWRLIGLLNRFEVKVEVLSDEAFESRNSESIAGHYLSRFKLIQIKDSALFCSQSSTLLHEFGHAIDHLVSSLCNGGEQISVKLWHWFSPQRRGFVSFYAEHNPAEYLAESLEAYFLHAHHQELMECDPAMFGFVDDLIAISCG